MTISTLLKDLKHATKLLNRIDAQLLNIESHDRKRIVLTLPKKERPQPVFKETFAMHPARTIFSSILADVATALNLVSLLITLLSGQSLVFQGFDQYCK